VSLGSASLPAGTIFPWGNSSLRPCEGRDLGASPSGKTTFLITRCVEQKRTHLAPCQLGGGTSAILSVMSFLDQSIVLTLNRVWQVLGHRTVKEALVALASSGSSSGAPAALAIDLAFAPAAGGGWDFSRPTSIRPVAWSEWLTLPIRDFDQAVRTPRGAVRAPTVLIASQHDRVPLRAPRPTREAIYARDGGICQYTGERVGRREGNLDHIVPRSRGGRDSFDNLVWARRDVNSRKADRLPHEAGLRLIRRPCAPRPVPPAALIREARHPDWRPFLY
jgi:5-methylcytosine-specific restriction endonuclease McrA